MSDLVVLRREQRILVEPRSQTVAVASIGLPGPQGEAGTTLVFATAAARDSAIPSPTTGQTAVTADTNTLWEYNGSAWVQMVTNNSWTTYTPALTASDGSSVSLGSGGNFRQAGRWTRFGKTIIAQVYLRWGSSGTSFGTGQYRISLPVAPMLNTLPLDFRVGNGTIYLGLPTGIYHGSAECHAGPGSYFIVRVIQNGTGASVASNTAPAVWANGDYIAGQVMYEAA